MTEQLSKLKNRMFVGHWLDSNKLFGHGVEIGVMGGYNAKNILRNWSGHLHLVDPWIHWDPKEYVDGANSVNMEEAYSECIRTMSEFPNRHTVCRLKSDDAFEHYKKLNVSFDFIYIDGCHHDPQVTRDVYQWWELLNTPGLYGGHDYMDINTPEYICEVKKTVDRFAKEKGVEVHITSEDPNDNSWWITKL